MPAGGSRLGTALLGGGQLLYFHLSTALLGDV